MTKQEAINELKGLSFVRSLIGEPQKQLTTKEAVARGTTEVDGSSWYIQPFWITTGDKIKAGKASFIVFDEGKETETVEWLEKPEAEKTSEEQEAAQLTALIKQKKLELQAETEAKKQLGIA